MTRLARGFLVIPFLVAAGNITDAQNLIKLTEVLLLGEAHGMPAGAHHFVADRGSRRGQSIVALTRDRPSAKGVSVSAGVTEYHLLSPEIVKPLPEVDVLGIHYVKVRPERRDAFEKFIAEKVHPAVGNLRPDLRILYYRAARGADAGNYIALFALTRASRDKYWPKGADSDELRAAFSLPVRALTRELRTYLVEGSYAADPKLAAAVYESREWTDYALVPPQTPGKR